MQKHLNIRSRLKKPDSILTPMQATKLYILLLFFLGPQPQTGEGHSGIQRLSVELGQCECTHRGQPYSIARTKTYRATAATTAATTTTDHRASTVCTDSSSNWDLFDLLHLVSSPFWLQPQHHWTSQTGLRPRVSKAINLPAARCSTIWVVML